MRFGARERLDMALLLKRVDIVIPDDVDLVWENDILEEGVLGKFRWWRPDEIALAGDASTLELLAGTCAHELTHREQFIRSPFLYWIQSVPGIRELTLEKEARRIELDVEERLGLGAVNK